MDSHSLGYISSTYPVVVSLDLEYTFPLRATLHFEEPLSVFGVSCLTLFQVYSSSLSNSLPDSPPHFSLPSYHCLRCAALCGHRCLPLPNPYPDSRVKEIVLDVPVHVMYTGKQPAPLLHIRSSAVNKDNVVIPIVH